MKNYSKLAWFGVALALFVVVLGAFVRLSDAGLGCPDWPGCYGHLDWPTETHEITKANDAFPERAVEPHKAWKEMVHRYFAGTLGLVVLALFLWAFSKRREMSYSLPLVLGFVIVFQAALGMWTVTLQLKPIIVMGHLMGGMLTLSLLFWLALSSSQKIQPYRYAGHVKQWMVGLALFLVILQIMLGGWTSSNYAALSCVGFPLCNGQLWPDMNFSEAFVMWRGLGVNYEFGVLDAPSRVAIQMAHRLGFVVVTLYLAWLTTRLMKNRELMPLGVTVAGLLLLQITLGIVNVTFSLPLAVATAHNGVAALLLLSLVALLYKTRKS
ncbi:MAG TPA: COX15/CtaA family protein [Gammaproteobacteria bacterium]|jgi:cytochrome c oxidase assembly protein subunit 15|nr:COX15/CtaA family protein [Xanthomonadales bacterium]MCB1593308.1 COX15/CtaA family protein [Xanthomonadales bacterium]HPI94948.1 COX15/CtaA family protein [Gammaproteobacteria bacterium]HPQ86214.1 COX15/CtaA family protein [Gammaproteobacteria bacterium]